MKNIIWLRRESRLTECRSPLLPDGAGLLIKGGYNIIVERSERRIISDHAYEKAGCRMVDGGSWMKAPKEAIILGLKELPGEPARLENTHIYFAHAYKEQQGWRDLLQRFTRGNGTLLDIEYMVDKNSSRVVAFGYWAGYMGAALALIHWHNRQSGRGLYLDRGLLPFDNADMLDDTIKQNHYGGDGPKVLIIGASGHCGQGALEILKHHRARITCWGRDETGSLDRTALLDHDILINCALIVEDVPAFVRRQDLTEKTRLRVIADVSCDPFSSFNPIPLYDDVTSWDKPYITVSGPKPVDIIAIDNLPSLLPRESSKEFADLLLPHLMTLNRRDSDPVWTAARTSFDKAIASMDNDPKKPEKIRAAG